MASALVARLINTPAFGRRCIPAPPHGAQSAPWGPRLAALLLAQIFPISSLVAPCQPGASAPSVRRRIYETDHLGCRVRSKATSTLQRKRQAPCREAPRRVDLKALRVEACAVSSPVRTRTR